MTWCCSHANRGCDQFDCGAGLANWEDGWSAEKKKWCCSKHNRACDVFDCDAGVANLQDGWSEAKKHYCCPKTGRGCLTTLTFVGKSEVPMLQSYRVTMDHYLPTVLIVVVAGVGMLAVMGRTLLAHRGSNGRDAEEELLFASATVAPEPHVGEGS